MSNAIFDVELYEAIHGKIETVIPSCIVERKIIKFEGRPEEKRRRFNRRRKLDDELKMAFAAILFGGIVCAIAGITSIYELWPIGIAAIVGGIGLLFCC